MLLDLLSAIIYLIQCKPSLFAAVWKAYIHFWKGRKNGLTPTTECDSPPTLPEFDKTIWEKSIVLHFFLHRKRLTFDRLNIL